MLEKASEIGAHILSGNVFETRALDELIPGWKELDTPIKTKVTKEKFLFLGKNKSLSWPTWLLPAVQKNHKNYIISLANLCRWLFNITSFTMNTILRINHKLLDIVFILNLINSNWTISLSRFIKFF